MERRQKTKYYCIIALAWFAKLPKTYRRKPWKSMFSITPLVWRPLSNEPPRISAQTLYWQKLESLGYIFVADSTDLPSFKFSVSSERRMCFETERIMTLQGHPRSLILAPIESLFDFNSNLGPILPRFRDIRAFVCRKPLFQHPASIRAKIPGCSPWSRPMMFGLQRANIPG